MSALTWSHSHHFWHPVFKLTANRVGAVKIFNYRIWVGHAVLLHNLPADTTSLCDVVFFSCGIFHTCTAHVIRQPVFRMRVQIWAQLVRGDLPINRFAQRQNPIAWNIFIAGKPIVNVRVSDFGIWPQCEQFIDERRLIVAVK